MATTAQFVDKTTSIAPRDIGRVRIMAGFYFASFWCIVFTGAVRKWLFPGQQIFYLLQDVPIFFAYVYGLWSGMFSRAYLLMGFIALSLMLMLQTTAQIIILPHEIFVALVGLHHYLFYWPMLLVFPLALTEYYRRNFIRWNLWFILPMTLLVLAQAVSPRNAFVNRTSEGDAFGLPGVEVARVSGTFNFVVFFATWVATCLSLCLGEWILRRERRTIQNRLHLAISTFCCVICVLISGSRQTIYLGGIAILGALLASVFLRQTRAMAAILAVCLILPIAAGLTYVISPVEFDTVKERLTGERGAADQHQRLLGAFTDFILLPKFSLIGAGIGLGVDASHAGNANTYNFTYELSEGDVARNVMELGTPVGLTYVLFFRLSFLVGMILLAIRLVRQGNSPHVLPLAMVMFGQGWSDMTRVATMTSSQVMIGSAFILGVHMYSDKYARELPLSEYSVSDLIKRSA